MFKLASILLILIGILLIALQVGLSSVSAFLIVAGLIIGIAAPYLGKNKKIKKPDPIIPVKSKKRSYTDVAILSLIFTAIGLFDLFFSNLTEGFDGFIWIFILPVTASICFFCIIGSWVSD